MSILSKFKNNLKLIPVHLLSLFAVWSIVFLLFHDYSEYESTYSFSNSYKFYLGIVSVVINYLTYFYFRTYYKWVLLLSLLLGLFDFLNFSTLDITLSFSLNHISFEPTALIAIISSIILFLSIHLLKVETEPVETIQVIPDENRIDKEYERFMKIYVNKSTEDLIAIMNDKRYTKEAVEAATVIVELRTADNEKNS